MEKGGYGASVMGQNTAKNSKQELKEMRAAEQKAMKKRLIWSFVFLLLLMYVSMGHMIGLPMPAFMHGAEGAVAFAFTQFLLTLPIVQLNSVYYKNGFKSLFNGSPNMDTLIAVGSSAGLVYARRGSSFQLWYRWTALTMTKSAKSNRSVSGPN